MSWAFPLLTTLTLIIIASCWIRSWTHSWRPRARGAVTIFLSILSAIWLAQVRSLTRSFQQPTAHDVYNALRPDVLLANHFRMVLTVGAIVWLIHRSWQTLWKPVPELINVLGVDVPEAPDVSLAGIRADAATLSWTPPAPNRPVQKYLIQVNGIHGASLCGPFRTSFCTNWYAVGESPGTDLAITVTGLKPNHFYNIRVVAMGPNNFQAASETIRLRTFGEDGKPYLGNSRVPTNFVEEDASKARAVDDGGANGPAACSFAASIELLDRNSNPARDGASTAPGQRRNTLNRRHSPSVTSSEQPPLRPSASDHDGPEQSLDVLSRQFQEIRTEINDTVATISTDEAEFQQAESELKQEKDQKRAYLKEKEEQTTTLKANVRTTMELMRTAEKEKAKKEGQLKEKEAKKSKVRDHIVKLEKEMERMKTERESFQAQKSDLERQRDEDVQQLFEGNAKLQEDHNELEADLSNKGKQLNEMKEARKHLAGADDEQSRASDEKTRREWEAARQALHHQLVEETKVAHQLDHQIHMLAEQIELHSQHQVEADPDAVFYGQSGDPLAELDMDHMPSTQTKRLSRNSNDMHMSPSAHFGMTDSPSQLPPGLNRPSTGFAPMLFMPESDEHQTEEEMRSAGGPLSPSAQLYLPSGIIDNESDTKTPHTPLLPESVTANEGDPQSPESSPRSFSVFSSPHSSTFNLPFPSYQDQSERGSLNYTPPALGSTGGLRLSSLLSSFHRNRTTKPEGEELAGPPIGTLKPGQSQSFPRNTDDGDIAGGKRRMSFSLKGHRNSTGLDSPNPFVGSKSLLGRRLNPFASSSGIMYADRDPTTSRPPSIASADLPRPSTDSGSIWGTIGDSSMAKSRLWSPNEGRWASRSGSRRPSIHGSPSALTTSLASADDEILYDTELNNTLPSQVGVIGSRPPGAAARLLSQRLNPAAPTFMGLFRNKDREVFSEKEKDKVKAKEKGKEQKGKGKEATPSIEMPPGGDESPSDSRMSRDTYSVHTQTSVSESHDSLSLDPSSSNPHLDLTPGLTSSSKDSDNMNGIRKLLRKGSSGKFSLSSRLGKDSSLFKKGPGSATNSDRNASADHRSSIGDLEELGEDPGLFGRSYESAAGAPSVGSAKSKETKEGRMASWRFIKKKGKETTTPSKEKESMEMDRALEEED
ncbi:uncharacterized protein F5Z01DRAFT_532190 [Emericellopsis atlantica]|uniref:Fibronectin type-III domain-containing protein n=1 Tax=Emericellopsis atlantica TaxID=2614577 RepID=A0A9P8CQJ1_9HYPO|nr:uncharacterized protein F5Z01DRAFT_532190 [Emericellopsis atlantica]KAG9255989.1 hypothetical protein F5Z01DRAFT_532190 [Emericellopsis atlantica]